MMGVSRIAIAGASLAALRAAEALRENGFEGRLTIVGDEAHAPYDRPPLSKQVALGMIGVDAATLPRFRAIDAKWRLGVAASHLDRANGRIVLADGRDVAYDRLLIATGARARPWPVPAEARLGGVLTLRTREDAAQFRQALAARPRRVVVIGGGFNGSEVASACRALDLPVTLVELNHTPLAAALGHAVGRFVADLQRAHGVDLRCATRVERLEGDANGQVRWVHLSGDPAPVAADLVVVALGTQPNVEWLAGAGLAAGPAGLACDAFCRVLDTNGQPDDHIFAAGDVACFPQPLLGGASRRIEHWSNAVEQGRAAAANMLVVRRAYDAVPSFWSSQFDVSIKAAGLPAAGSEIAFVQGAPESGSFVVLYGRNGRLVGAVAFDQGKWLARYLPLIARGAPFPGPPGMDAPPQSAPREAEFPPGGGPADLTQPHRRAAPPSSGRPIMEENNA